VDLGVARDDVERRPEAIGAAHQPAVRLLHDHNRFLPDGL
jgi:hypothetical protein